MRATAILAAIDFLTINDDKLTLQKQVSELTEKSKEENYIIKGKLSDKEKEIQLLRQRDSMNTDAISGLSDRLTIVMQEIEILKNQRGSSDANMPKKAPTVKIENG